jgi:formiminotetrahydrofolate cyclodeaminase
MNKDQDLLSMSVKDFLSAVAQKSPTPGGGSVAGTVGALGVALGEMSLNFTRGKKKFAQHEPFYEHLGSRLARARAMFIDLVADDVAAYGFYAETAKLPDGPDKDEKMQLALAASIDVPREMTKLAIALMEDLLTLADKCNPYLLSDLMAGATLAAAAARLSDYNVRINVPQLTDTQAGKEVQQSSTNDLARANQLLADIEKACGR